MAAQYLVWSASVIWSRSFQQNIWAHHSVYHQEFKCKEMSILHLLERGMAFLSFVEGNFKAGLHTIWCCGAKGCLIITVNTKTGSPYSSEDPSKLKECDILYVINGIIMPLLWQENKWIYKSAFMSIHSKSNKSQWNT